jgi:hypothetical protein
VLWAYSGSSRKILLLECGASESRLSARHALDLLPPCANRLHAGSTAKYRYLSIQKNVQDGSVWLMIGKPHLKRRDKFSFAPQAAPGETEIQLPLYPRKQTLFGNRSRSEKCQTRTSSLGAARPLPEPERLCAVLQP